MLASAVAAGLLVGLAARGSFRRLVEVPLRWWPLFLTAVALRGAAIVPLGADVQHALYLISLWSLLVVAVRNFLLPGAWLIAGGVGANAIVITITGGAMPVSLAATAAAGTRPPADPLHVVGDPTSPLGDIIPVPLLGVYSIGDILLAIGVFVLIVWTMRGAS